MKINLLLKTTMVLAIVNLGAAQNFITIGSGVPTGVYFPVATGIAKLINDANLPARANVRSTGGSVFNVNALASGELQMALVQSDIASYAYNGSGIATFQGRPVRNIRAIASLYPEVVHIVARADANIRKVSDLRGKRVVVGDTGSGTEQNARQILEAYGLSFNDLGQTLRVGLTPAVALLQDGQADAVFFTGGLVNAGVAQIARTVRVTMVEVDYDKVRTLSQRYPFYVPVLIPGGTYSKIDVTTPTVAVQAVWVVAESLSEDTVYAITKTVFESSDFKKIHPNLERSFDVRRAVRALPIPLHPGAARYFRERGILP